MVQKTLWIVFHIGVTGIWQAVKGTTDEKKAIAAAKRYKKKHPAALAVEVRLIDFSLPIVQKDWIEAYTQRIII